MPELPEMENYRRLLIPRVVDRPITDVHIQREKSLNVPADLFTGIVRNNRITSVERRAKHLFFHMASGSLLHLHLMLGGWMYYSSAADKPKRTAQVTLSFGEQNLYFLGLRLGYLHLLNSEDRDRIVAQLGPEPLEPDFTMQKFSDILRGRRTNLKMTLVDQSILSGIGNCYSDEICFYGGLLPIRNVSGLSEEELERLHQSIRSVLSEAIHYGGYMESPFYAGDELTGKFDSRCKVYDREGEPCLRCGHPLIMQEVNSRKCFYCTNCQH